MGYWFLSFLLITGIPSTAFAVQSFSSNCAVGFVICWSYDFTAVCNDGFPVGGGGYWTSEDAANAANSACATHGGLDTPDFCPDGTELFQNVCLTKVYFPGSLLSDEERASQKPHSETQSAAFCSHSNRWSCQSGNKLSCLSPETPCGDRCPSGRKNMRGKCVLK
jgi:hypothetical protein